MEDETEVLLTPEEAARRLSVKPRSVRQWLRDGKLRGVRLAGAIWRVRPADLQAFIEAGFTTPPARGTAPRKNKDAAESEGEEG